MKTYHYDINGYIKGVTTAKTKRGAKKYSKGLAKVFCPNIKIKSVKITRMKNCKPLVCE